MKKYGLIGKKLDYSYSKLIHDYLIKKFNLNATYELIETNSINKALLEQYDGLNITIPYKEEVIKYLDVKTMPLASYNTITKVNDKLYGDNTDLIGFGFLVDQLNLKKLEKVVILGSGGSSKMVQHYFRDLDVTVISRKDEVYNYDLLNSLSGDVLINTTPVGMNEYNSIVSKEQLSKYNAIIDLNYNPINSKLSFDTKHTGRKFIGGLYMLIVQALASFEIWNGIGYDNALIEEVYNHILLSTHDKIALIGMPLAGKSTIIKEFDGVDVDDNVVARNKENIKTLLESGFFRELETRELDHLVRKGAKLIALGGGAVLNHRNMEIIKDYIIVFIDTPLLTLLERYEDGIRPLLKNKEELIKLYKKRQPLYLTYANIILQQDELREILNEIYNN